MMDIGGILASAGGALASGGLTAVFGGITGVVGSIVTFFGNYKMQKLKNEHEVAMITAESEAMRLEMQMKIEVTREETKGKVELADLEALMKSYEYASKPAFAESYMEKLYGRWWTVPVATFLSLLFGLVDFLKQFIRPGLTSYLVILSTFITLWSYDILKTSLGAGNILSVDQAFKIFFMAVSMILYLTVTAVTWHYSDRGMAKFLMKLSDGNIKS
ncbi:hypothetical protein KKH23_10510 [Patescibacteria group bacterium]|nr:hypothetical protein [Patescibacteria group bacterium]